MSAVPFYRHSAAWRAALEEAYTLFRRDEELPCRATENLTGLRYDTYRPPVAQTKSTKRNEQ